MRRRPPRWPGPAGLAAILGAVTSGCGDPGGPPGLPAGGAVAPSSPGRPVEGTDTGRDPFLGAGMDSSMRTVLVENVVSLLERAPLMPGGDNINIATKNLNQLFKATPDADFRLTDEARSYLTEQLEGAPFRVEDFETRGFELKDARHIEDCLLYHNIAARVAGPGTVLDRVRRLFDWSVRHVQLVPPEAVLPEMLAAQGLNPVPARPYDVIIRGFGSEIPGDAWAERSWVFLALCRQIGVDAAMIGYDVEGRETPYEWACAALVDGVPYLFDARIGMEIPAPGGVGVGVASMEQAATVPGVLDGLDLPEPPIPYPTGADDLARVRVFIDSSRGYFAPKMGALQKELAGANRMVLHRDPAAQRDAWAAALGDRLEAVDLWGLPLTVEYRLFTDPSYVQAIQRINSFFTPELPLLGARLLHLRGDLAEAKQEYTRFRFRQVPRVDAEGLHLPPEVLREIQEALDLYATYFLALAQLEDGMTDQAINLFEQALRLPPEEMVVRGRTDTLLRLGATANLGLLYEARGDAGRATYYYTRNNSTPQSQGNLLHANALVFADPFGPAPPPPADPSTGAEGPSIAPGTDATADAAPGPSGEG